MIRRKVVKKAQPMFAPPEVQTTAEWEEWVVQNGNYFRVAWKVGPGQIMSKRFESLSAAIQFTASNPGIRGMVYACMNVGRSVMIGPSQYPRMLQLRGEK